MAQLSSPSQKMSVTPTSTSTLSKVYHGSGLLLSSFPPLILLGRKRVHHTDFCNYRSLLFSDTGILLTEQLYFLPIPTKSPLTWTLSCCKPFHYANYSGVFCFFLLFLNWSFIVDWVFSLPAFSPLWATAYKTYVFLSILPSFFSILLTFSVFHFLTCMHGLKCYQVNNSNLHRRPPSSYTSVYLSDNTSGIYLHQKVSKTFL